MVILIDGLVSSLSHGLGVLAHCSDGFCVHKTGKCGFSCFPDTSTTRENINLKTFLGEHAPAISVLCTLVPQPTQSHTASSATAIRQSPLGLGTDKS